MASDTDQFLPLYPNESEATIRARWDAWANEGLSPDQVDLWTDTREGGFFQLTTQPGVREAAKLYDLIGTEFIQAATPIRSWGPYLEDQAAVQDVLRTAAQQATGVVTFSSDVGVDIAVGTRVGVEPSSPDADAPEYLTTAAGTVPAGGTLDLPIRAVEAGVVGDASAGAVTLVLTPNLAATVSNAAAISGGTEEETDESLRGRLLEAYQGQGPGNVTDYIAWSRAFLGGGRVTVLPLADGPGTVTVIAIDANGDPLQPDRVTALQDWLDPVPGQGKGAAPIGVTVTVATAAVTAVTIGGTLEFDDGYDLDGSDASVGLRGIIEQRLADYVSSVEPGQEIVLSKVAGVIVGVVGVHDASGVTLNGSAANVTVVSSPTPQLPRLTVPTDLVAA